MKTIEIKDWYTEEHIHFLTGENITIKDVVQDAVKNDISLKYADLTRAILRGAILIIADLSISDLTYSDLTESYLYHTSLKQADLKRADLTLSNLRCSDLTGSILIDTNFTHSVLEGVIVNEQTEINQYTYSTIPDKYKHIFDVCTFID